MNDDRPSFPPYESAFPTVPVPRGGVRFQSSLEVCHACWDPRSAHLEWDPTRGVFLRIPCAVPGCPCVAFCEPEDG